MVIAARINPKHPIFIVFHTHSLTHQTSHEQPSLESYNILSLDHLLKQVWQRGNLFKLLLHTIGLSLPWTTLSLPSLTYDSLWQQYSCINNLLLIVMMYAILLILWFAWIYYWTMECNCCLDLSNSFTTEPCLCLIARILSSINL